MDENVKFRRDMIFKVLTWGTVVYFLVMGYSLDRSSLFEYRAPYRPALVALDAAKEVEASRLISEAEKLESISSTLPTAEDPEKRGTAASAAKRRVEAAQLRKEAFLASEERKDGRERARGLMMGAAIYSLFYPILVWLTFKQTAAGAVITEKDVIPVWAAMAYAIFMSIATSWTAFATALQ